MRHRYLVAYDVCDPKRLTRTRKTMRGYGDPLQYSLFVCDLTREERVLMLEAVMVHIDRTTDRLLIADLGPVASKRRRRVRVELIGQPLSVPEDGAVIV